MSLNGAGAPEDAARAAELFQSACDGAEPRGCLNLGQLYEAGKGVAKDSAAALTLYRKACGLGHVRACAEAERLSRS